MLQPLIQALESGKKVRSATAVPLIITWQGHILQTPEAQMRYILSLLQ